MRLAGLNCVVIWLGRHTWQPDEISLRRVVIHGDRPSSQRVKHIQSFADDRHLLARFTLQIFGTIHKYGDFFARIIPESRTA
jgi:hypothetical protein